jgi:hypothetical protein
MNGLMPASRLCHVRPRINKPQSTSRRVQAWHNIKHCFHTETLSALNVLSQNVSVSAEPFPACLPDAATLRDSDYISGLVNSYLHACRKSGGKQCRPSIIAASLPHLSDYEFLNAPSATHTPLSVLSTPLAAGASISPSHTLPPSIYSAEQLDIEFASFGSYGVNVDSSSSAVDIDFRLVSIPDQAGTVELSDLLEPEQIAYMTPSALLRPDAPPPGASPAATRILHGHYPPLLRRLHAAQLIVFSQYRPKVINGLFAVFKPDGTQRLIIDARRANSQFVDPPHVELCTPDRWANLQVAPGVKIYTAKADIADYYHKIKMPELWWPYFGLPSVHPAEVGMADAFPGVQEIWPMIVTLPMGFNHAVFLGQSLHKNFVEKHVPLLRSCDMVGASNDWRLDRLRWSVYIDDLIIVSPSESDANAALHQYNVATRTAKLFVKPEKLCEAVLQGADITGLRVDGERATLGVAPHKLALLASQTLSLIRSTEPVSQKSLSSILGKWSWAMLVRRPLLSVFASVYRWVEAFPNGDGFLWPSVKLELALACALAPLMVANLSCSWFGKVVAVDASSTGQGVVSSTLPTPIVDELASKSGRPPAAAIRSDDIVDLATRRAIFRSSQVSAGQQLPPAPWQTIVSSRWKRAEHINSLEATSLRSAVRWIRGHSDVVGRRVLILSDSAVVVAATTKGRSSSRLLLMHCRLTAAFVLSCGLRLFIHWIPSEVNPADDASRRS